MSDKHYQIEVLDDIVLVTLRGQWDMSTNIQYLAAFAEALNARRGKAFHIIVDMRTWVVPNTTLFTRIKAPIQIDRRNQRSEFWLEGPTSYVDHIAEKFAYEQNFQLLRNNDENAFLEHIEAAFSEDTTVRIVEWLARHAVDKQN